MSSFKDKKILFQTVDGQKFLVDTSNCETFADVQREIQKLREKHNIPAPDFMAAQILDPSLEINAPHVDDLEPELREAVTEAVAESFTKVDPRSLN